jgi:hypothetical protein
MIARSFGILISGEFRPPFLNRLVLRLLHSDLQSFFSVTCFRNFFLLYNILDKPVPPLYTRRLKKS